MEQKLIFDKETYCFQRNGFVNQKGLILSDEDFFRDDDYIIVQGISSKDKAISGYLKIEKNKIKELIKILEKYDTTRP